MNLKEHFRSLNFSQRLSVSIRLAEKALEIWKDYCKISNLSYRDGITLESSEVRSELLLDSFRCAQKLELILSKELHLSFPLQVSKDSDLERLRGEFKDHVIALQDGDWIIPEQVSSVFHAVYNLIEAFFVKRNCFGEFPLYVSASQAASAVISSRLLTYGETHKLIFEEDCIACENFLKLWTRSGGSANANLFYQIERKYSEPHRSYHNIDHIIDCLQKLHDEKNKTPDAIDTSAWDTIELAIWFHDIVYDRIALNNEASSVKWFKKCTEEGGLSEKITREVCEMIMATRAHQIPPDADTFQMRLFLDIDLSILGSEQNRFNTYEMSILNENNLLPEFLYRFLRKNFLKKLLSKPSKC